MAGKEGLNVIQAFYGLGRIVTQVLDGLPLLRRFETTDDDEFPQPIYMSPRTSYFHLAIYYSNHVKEAGGVTALFFL